MNWNWRNTFTKIMAWLIVETILNLMGLDNIADYSEFVFERYRSDVASFSSLYTTVFETSLDLKFCSLT